MAAEGWHNEVVAGGVFEKRYKKNRKIRKKSGAFYLFLRVGQ